MENIFFDIEKAYDQLEIWNYEGFMYKNFNQRTFRVRVGTSSAGSLGWMF